MTRPRSDVVWTGDLSDDCFLRVGRWYAHVEKMGRNDWWCAIYGSGFELNASDVTMSSGECLWFTSGHDARQFCEYVIQTHSALRSGKPVKGRRGLGRKK